MLDAFYVLPNVSIEEETAADYAISMLTAVSMDRASSIRWQMHPRLERSLSQYLHKVSFCLLAAF
jgi:hypothetical protein